MTPEERSEIDSLSHTEMAWLWRFAPVGNKFFTVGADGDDTLMKYFSQRFKRLGGMTSKVSKEIGWNR